VEYSKAYQETGVERTQFLLLLNYLLKMEEIEKSPIGIHALGLSLRNCNLFLKDLEINEDFFLVHLFPSMLSSNSMNLFLSIPILKL
jgi:hypothetical protein